MLQSLLLFKEVRFACLLTCSSLNALPFLVESRLVARLKPIEADLR